MTSRATVRPAPERPSWFIPDDAVTDWSQEHVAVGGYGEVFTAFYYGSKVAVKRLHAHFDDDALTYFAREIGVWHRLSHPYILPLLGACDKDTRGKFIRPFMVSPFMPNGTLLKYVSDPNNPRSTEEKLRLLYQVAAGVAYLHGNSIIHADLKAANVLLDSSFNAVLTDFGLSRTKRTSESAARARTSAFEGGTQGYMAPEMLDGDEPAGNSKLTDVFAFAVTIYEVINNGKVWITKDNTPMQPFQIGFQICSGKRPKRFDGIPDDIWDLIERCWAQSPSDRPSFAEILVALQPYDCPAPIVVAAPSSIELSTIDQVASQLSVLSINSQPPSLADQHDELKFDGINSATRLPDSLLTRAKQGNPDACLDAANLISEGLPARHQDWKLAGQLCKAASDRGNLEASFRLAWLQLTGEGVVQNDNNAFSHWQEVSTKSTDPVIKSIATHMVGWMYYLGRGTVQDVQKGVKIIRDNKSFTFRLGEDNCLAVFSGANSDSTASQKFFEFCLLGSQQDWLCRHLMAVCLLYGFGTMQDRTKAARIFEELANDGHSDSQFWIGMCYCCGGGVSQDRSKAAEWFGKSADLGNSYGQWWVGVSYLGGFGVTQDLPKAVEWLHKSAEQGNRYGQNDLGYCYRRGCGVTENIGTALYWFRKSAEQGHDAAIDSLGDLNKRL